MAPASVAVSPPSAVSLTETPARPAAANVHLGTSL
jgi:hypothetical protein